ncbi:MAG: hypothetical protein UX09_C0049G0002 [Candidatus Uhrbacteria bacterium GW2011_GWE2_45_35]|uniref:Uncharacterized protein n=2 Tax=Candidatus Uhriibacteriota TaxID=1752732 RepID=A0A0G1JAH2_9BACT|nr:MAG: hypothetical protein UW63_C0072G0002 [Candidatus Uhrbacteria bacterium GW2011_GWF2_44_350]KKU06527.1 MAG: hypothetical protein UX09_C0049G0002 [Candidatus Uhrbacteria bacterium GW2011_GWE2_45_35]HBR80726.1 hypothetical protein [Candidatus Uhrbacteria bacterium]HCU31424.1 hypothetical protein [Candidatus Uhrbacteria bacterium]
MTINKIIDKLLYTTIFLLPLFFLPWTLEPLEVGKQTLLFLIIAVSLIILLISFFKKNTLVFKKNFVSQILVLFLALLAVSAALSGSHFLSWIGFSKQEYTSFASLLFLALFFWFISSQTREASFFPRAIISALSGATLAGLIGILAVSNFYLPFSFAQTQVFNTVGTLNSLGVFLIIATILANSFFLLWHDKKKLVSALIVFLSIITFGFLVLLNYWLLWVILLVGLGALLLMVFLRAHELHHTKKYLISMFMAVGAIIFLFIPLRLISVPAEVSPNTAASLEIAKQSMTGKSFWFGTGPGTYVFDYAKFRPLEVNQTDFWNTRFDRGSSELLTMLPTKGFLPTAVLIFFALTLTITLAKKYFQHQEKQWQAFILIPAWLSSLFAFTVYPANFTLVFTFFFLAGLIFSLSDGGHLIKINLSKTPRIKIISSVATAFCIVAMVTVIFLLGQRFVAEYAFAKAVRLDRLGGNVQEITQLIDRAASLNRYNDSYYRNLAQILLVEVQDEISAIGSSEPTADQSKYLQALVAASINSAKRAVELEPRNITNWLELGLVYRSFIPILDQSGGFAIAAFQTAISLEPANPTNYVELGKVFLSIAAVNEENQAKNFVLADQNFEKAIELKNDYAPAHYQLALSYEQQGRLDDAIGKMENIVNYNSQDIGAGFELGVLYLRRGLSHDLDAAENILTQVVTLLPSYSNAHWYLGYVYEQKHDYEAAIAEIEKVLELNPDNEIVKIHLESLKDGLPAPVKDPVAPDPIVENDPS